MIEQECTITVVVYFLSKYGEYGFRLEAFRYMDCIIYSIFSIFFQEYILK